MKRTLFLLCLAGLLTIAGSASGRTATRPIPDAGPAEVPNRTPQSDAVFDTLFAYRGERVIDVTFVYGFAPGASRDISASQLARIRPGGYLIGATDLERFDGKRNTRNMSQMNNISLGIARANFVNAKTGYRSTVLPQVIFNDRRGVYQVFTKPINPPVGPSTIVYRDTSSTREPSPYFGDWIRLGPQGGISYLHAGGHDFVAPMTGLWITKRRWTMYGQYGRAFTERDDHIFKAGLQYLFTRQISLELAWVDAWTDAPYIDHYDDRATGPMIGLGLNAGSPRWNVNVQAGIGPFNVLDPSRLENHCEFGVLTSAYAGFTF